VITNCKEGNGKPPRLFPKTGYPLGYSRRLKREGGVRVSVRVKIKVRLAAAFYPIDGPQVRSPHFTRGHFLTI